MEYTVIVRYKSEEHPRDVNIVEKILNKNIPGLPSELYWHNSDNTLSISAINLEKAAAIITAAKSLNGIIYVDVDLKH